jgi:hypothetical protein
VAGRRGCYQFHSYADLKSGNCTEDLLEIQFNFSASCGTVCCL